MKYRLFLWMMAALLVVAGCTNDEIASEQPTPEAEKGKITLTASVPDETPQTRLSLNNPPATLNITVKWKANDVVNFFFKQGDVIKKGTPVTLTQYAISDDGKTATFTVAIPAGIDGNAAYTLYAVHGAPVSLDVPGKINVNVSPVGFEFVHLLRNVPIVGETNINAGASIGTINFNHLGVLQCIHIKNISGTAFLFTPSLANEGGTTWHYTYSGGNIAPCYDLIGKQVSNATITPVSNPNVLIILSGGNQICAQWVMPIPNATVPEIKLKAATPGGNIVSVNSKPARANPMQIGRAYHLYALWNGTSLYFTDSSFNPPLVGDLMHAAGGIYFIGLVYSKGDNKVYYSTRHGNSWPEETLLGTGTQARVAIDYDKHPHVVFTTNDHKIAYCKHDGTAWSTEYITSNYGGACSKPDIAMGSNGIAHITYTDTKGQAGNDYIPDIMYATNSSGTFVKTVIYNGYYSNVDKEGYYYNKGSRIAVDPSGNYYIIAHQDRRKDYPGTHEYRLVIKTSMASGRSSYDIFDKHNIYDLEFDNRMNCVRALYKEKDYNRTAIIEVNGNKASFIDLYDITTTTADPHGISLCGEVAGLSGSNLFVKYSNAGTPVENIYSDITVKAKTRVAAVNKSNVLNKVYIIYTDNADSHIKVMEIASW